MSIDLHQYCFQQWCRSHIHSKWIRNYLKASRMSKRFQRFPIETHFQSVIHSPRESRTWHESGQGGFGRRIGSGERPFLNQESSATTYSGTDRLIPLAWLGAVNESLLGAAFASAQRTATTTRPLRKISIILVDEAARFRRDKTEVCFGFSLVTFQELRVNIRAHRKILRISGLFKVDGSRNVIGQPKYGNYSKRSWNTNSMITILNVCNEFLLVFR